MGILIAVCLVLITVALVFGREAAQGLIGCALSIVFWLFIFGVIAVFIAMLL